MRILRAQQLHLHQLPAVTLARRCSSTRASSKSSSSSSSSNLGRVFIVSNEAEAEEAVAALRASPSLLPSTPLTSYLLCRRFIMQQQQEQQQQQQERPGFTADPGPHSSSSNGSSSSNLRAAGPAGSAAAAAGAAGAAAAGAAAAGAAAAGAAAAETKCALVLGCDCEGALLGRFGKLALLQLASLQGSPLCLVDVLKQEALSPGLQALYQDPTVLKACTPAAVAAADAAVDLCSPVPAAAGGRAAAAVAAAGAVPPSPLLLLLLLLLLVVVAHQLICMKRGKPAYQASLKELFETYLHLKLEGHEAAKEALSHDVSCFLRRPLPSPLLRYAAAGVGPLVKLALVMSMHIDPEAVVAASENFVLYRHLNESFKSHQEMRNKGTLLEGKHQILSSPKLWTPKRMVAVRTPDKIVFKLNTNAVGIVSSPAALKRFQDVQLGEIVSVCVVGDSQGGQYLYLDRHDGLFDFSDVTRTSESSSSSWLSGERRSSRLPVAAKVAAAAATQQQQRQQSSSSVRQQQGQQNSSSSCSNRGNTAAAVHLCARVAAGLAESEADPLLLAHLN
ncbi:hypothetical protein Esti_002655 [Eimeria stiedai]